MTTHTDAEFAALKAELAASQAQVARLQAALREIRDAVEANHLEHSSPIPSEEPTDEDWRVTLLIEKADAALAATANAAQAGKETKP